NYARTIRRKPEAPEAKRMSQYVTVDHLNGFVTLFEERPELKQSACKNERNYGKRCCHPLRPKLSKCNSSTPYSAPRVPDRAGDREADRGCGGKPLGPSRRHGHPDRLPPWPESQRVRGPAMG